MASQPPLEQSLPDRSKEDAEGAAPGPSKNALKKAAKEKEKAEKAAKRKEADARQQQEMAAADVSANDYGDLPLIGSADYHPPGDNRTTLDAISAAYTENTAFAEDAGGPHVAFRAVVENAREQSAKLTFLVLGHGLHTIQAVVAASESTSRQMVKFAKNVTAQSQVLVHGVVKKPREYVKSTTIGHLEVHVTRLFVIARAEVPLPIQVEDCERPLPEEPAEQTVRADPGSSQAVLEKEGSVGRELQREEGRPIVTLNTRLNNRTVDLRARLNLGIFRIKDGVTALFSEFARQKGFVGVQTPKLSGASSEGGSAVFKVQYFERDGFLAQSPQLYKQMLIAAQFERVFEIGPIFRAENSNTARHLTEFTGLDLEMAFEEHYHEVVDLLEEMMLYIFDGLRSRYKKETELVRKTYHVDEFRIPEKGHVPRIPYWEGLTMLRGAGVEIGDYDDLSTTQEKLLGRLILEKYSSDFYILDQYPLAVRPFYTMPSPRLPPNPPNATTSPSTPTPAAAAATAAAYSNSYDFHMRGTEILSGAQRVHDPSLLQQRMRAMQPPVNPDAPGLKEYVDAFRAGCPPHAGAGLGLERIVMLWLGLPNVRLASAFPRDPGRLMP